MSLNAREYLRQLSRVTINPFTRIGERDTDPETPYEILKHLKKREVSAVVVHGSHGAGKRLLSYQVYRDILSIREPSDLVAYFSFKACDRRQRSVCTMLLKIIQQLLACEPELIPSVQEIIDNDDEETQWTEANLWVQLRFIIRKSCASTIYLVIDSFTSWMTPDTNEYTNALFELRFAAPKRLKIVCTGTSNATIPTTPAVVNLDLDTSVDFKKYFDMFQASLVDEIVSENLKFEASRSKIKECLANSNQFLHSNLLSHRIRSMRCLSSPTSINSGLKKLASGWEETIVDMVSAVPSWVVSAVSWMTFALRPLRSMELAIAVALANDKRFGSLEIVTEFDQQSIPLDIRGDLVQYLGPLVCTEHGEIKISHVYIEEVLRSWIDRTQHKMESRERVLTVQLMNYLQFCLKRMKADCQDDVPDEASFGLIEYCFENWHVHYRNTTDDVKKSLSSRSTGGWLEDLVLSLFRDTEYRQHLRPADLSKAKAVPDALQLAARFGLLNIFEILINKREDSEQENTASNISALHYACRHGHVTIVEKLIDKVDDASVDLELTRACRRGDEAIVMRMLERYLKMRQSADFPPDLLPEVCRMGHKSLVKKLIDKGANVNLCPTNRLRLPLHEAVDQGHYDIVDLLLDEKSNAMALYPEDASTPLLHSVERGYKAITDRLLKVDGLEDTPNKDGITALHLAARRGDTYLMAEIFKIRRVAGPSLERCTSPLHEAAAHGHLEAVEAIVKHFPTSINEINPQGQSALFLALLNNQRHVADYLLSTKPKITLTDVYADSALKQAVIHGNLEATKALLGLPGADVNRYLDTDASPLTDAAWKNYSDITRVLFNAHADPLKTVHHEVYTEIIGENPSGKWTAAHFAAYYNSKDAMRVLMTDCMKLAGIATNTGHTPLHLAVARDWIEIVDIMLPGAKESAGVIPKTKLKNSTVDLLPTQPKSAGSKEDATISSTPQSGQEGDDPPSLDINAQTQSRLTALHIAAANCSIDLVKILIKSGADPKVFDYDGRAPIHLAASAGKRGLDVLRFLLQPVAGRSKVDVDLADFNGHTPLHYATESSDEAAVRLLLNCGADTNVPSAKGATPLYLAVTSGNEEIVRCLIEYGAEISTKTNGDGDVTSLHAAVLGGHDEIVKILLAAGADVNAADADGDTPLHEAAREGNLAMVRMLLTAGANVNAVNARFITPLQRAILNHWPKTAKILLGRGADPNIRDEDGDNALTSALLSKDINLVKVLLARGADKNILNRSEKTPLMLALRSPNDLLPLLLEAKPDLLKCGDSKITVLHRAAAETTNATADGILELLRHGKAHLNVPDFEGQAPVHHAAKFGRPGMLKVLPKFKADLGAKDAQGRTAMHHAVMAISAADFEEVFDKFLKPSSDNHVNIPDFDGWTPLHWACKSDLLDIVELLLRKCETVQDRRKMIMGGKNGWTALAVAEFHCQFNTVKVLEQALELEITTTEAEGLETIIRTLGEHSESAPKVLRPAKPGYLHSYVSCDDCLHGVSPRILSCERSLIFRLFYTDDFTCQPPIYGLRFKCKQHFDFDLCFKCYWHHKKTHRPKGHDFECMGAGPLENPEFMDPLPHPIAPAPPNSPARMASRSSTLDTVEDATNTTSTDSSVSIIVREAARATSAAPSYFRSYEVSRTASNVTRQDSYSRDDERSTPRPRPDVDASDDYLVFDDIPRLRTRRKPRRPTRHPVEYYRWL